jgi:2,3-bisphosphoglycerate-independent phosphoglycerate mutase
MSNFPKTALVIIDGFGFNPNPQGNAILEAKTPNLDSLWSHYPHTLLKAAEDEVGLSFGQIGNSEVGHMAIGTGRVVASSHQKINEEIQNGNFFTNQAFTSAISYAKANNSKLHLMGMISTAGVHSDVNQMIALIKLAKQLGISRLYLHPILDGRDTGPKEAKIYLDMLDKAIKQHGIGTIASVSGRSYAMDRNKNWEKIKAYWEVVTGLSKSTVGSAYAAVDAAYAAGLDDETVPPATIDTHGIIESKDAVIITNFRGDRARQITHTLADANFTGFQRTVVLHDLFIVAMIEYEVGLAVSCAYPAQNVPNTLADAIEAAGMTQLHIAETEKYAHVTYFFNGGREARLPHEEHVHVPSDPPNMFLDKPEMKAREITEYVVTDLAAGKHDFVVANIANPDMIGHTGHLEQTIKAVEITDVCLGKIAQAVLALNGTLFVSSDHGNAEQKIDIKTGQPSKDHTVNPVPFIKIANNLEAQTSSGRVTQGADITGILQDIAPTILTSLGLQVPEEMTGENLF